MIGLPIRPVPEHLRPLAAVVQIDRVQACEPRIMIERPLTRERAERRIKELGRRAAPRLRYCERLRCWDKRISWTAPEPRIE